MKNIKMRIYAIMFVGICYSTFLWWQQDDFYIHLQYAKNFTKSFVWAFNSGIPSYGTTSPLWVMLLICFGMTNIDLTITAKILSIILGIGTFLLLYDRAKQFRYRILFFIFIVSIGFNHWYRLAVGAGMEATLASLCITLLFLRTYRKDESVSYSFFNGFLTGLCILVRPEFIYIPLLFIAVELFSKKAIAQKWTHMLVLNAGVVVVILPWIIFTQIHIHSIIPTTILIKTGGHANLTNILSAFSRVIAFYLPISGVELAAGVFFIVFLIKKQIAITDAMLLRVGLIAGIPAIYLFNQAIGGASITYRYAAPTIPILIFASYKFIDVMISNNWMHSRKHHLLIVMVSIIVIVPNIWLSLMHIPYLVKSNNYLSVLVKYGKYLKQYSSISDTVACYDVGAVGYYSDRFVLDLVGLVSPETIQYKGTELYNEVAIDVFKPAYIIVPWFADMYNQLELYPKGIAVFRDSVYNYRFQITAAEGERSYMTELRRLR